MVSNRIKNMPDKLDVLSNWNENPRKAEIEIYNSLIENNRNLQEIIQSLWFDCYKGYESEFVKTLVNKSLIDGIIIPQQNNILFLIAYNPDILKIINTEIVKS